LTRFLLGLLPAVLFAGGMRLDFTPPQTTVAYSVSSTLHTVHGTFRLTRGVVHFDPATGQASGELVVDASSGTSGSDGRDKKMHKEVIESAKYPEITFRPDRVEGAVAAEGVSTVKVHGIFGIHGVEHAITVPAEVRLSAGQASVKLRFTVPYVKWGMKDPGNFLLKVKDTVELAVEATAAVVVE
jgi:polyisoprenoid-binding protein YceI